MHECAQTPVRRNGAVQIQGIDHVELYVGNAFQAAHFYRTVFGFTPIAYAGLETGVRDRTSYVMEQGRVRLVLTSPLDPDSELASWVRLHGDGTRDVAFTVPDATAAFEIAVSRGARPISPPRTVDGVDGMIVTARIGAFGDSIHSFIERRSFYGTFAPGFHPLTAPKAVPVGIHELDHVAIGMTEGDLERWVDFYVDVMGFIQAHDEMVFTERSRMNSKVVEDASGVVKFPLLEPKGGAGKSQIDEYLSFHRGCGTQHIAFGCRDVCEAVTAVRANGLEFVRTPRAYYDALEARVGAVGPDEMERLRSTDVLVDSDDYGRLLQIFTKPVTGRPTMFLELIERRGARGFGAGNIQALFEAVEREQIRRGTL
jgi:4-hydroxyphenylpyruvate dioxygenase